MGQATTLLKSEVSGRNAETCCCMISRTVALREEGMIAPMTWDWRIWKPTFAHWAVLVLVGPAFVADTCITETTPLASKL